MRALKFWRKCFGRFDRAEHWFTKCPYGTKVNRFEAKCIHDCVCARAFTFYTVNDRLNYWPKIETDESIAGTTHNIYALWVYVYTVHPFLPFHHSVGRKIFPSTYLSRPATPLSSIPCFSLALVHSLFKLILQLSNQSQIMQEKRKRDASDFQFFFPSLTCEHWICSNVIMDILPYADKE